MGSTTVFAGSTGEPDTAWYDENPSADEFTIYTADQLAGLAKIVNDRTDTYTSEIFANKTIILANDIDLSAYASGEGWTPISDFSGVFDGNHKIITGLMVNRQGNNAGLFGSIRDATIKNLGLAGVDVTGYRAGGLVAVAGFGNVIENCYVTGTVTGNRTFCYVGGIAGIFGGNITNSYFDGTVVSGTIPRDIFQNYMGGIAGHFSGIMENCYSAGELWFVAPPPNIINGFIAPLQPPDVILGGLAGSLSRYWLNDALTEFQNSSIKNSYTTISLPRDFSNSSNIGGIAGSGSYSEIMNCVALNPIMANQRRERIVCTYYPQFGDAFILFGNYALYDRPISEWTPKGHDQYDGADVTMEEALTAAFWTETMGWDTNVWIIEDGELPRLRMCCTLENPCADCFDAPPTGVRDVASAFAAMVAFILVSVILWAYGVRRNKKEKELQAYIC